MAVVAGSVMTDIRTAVTSAVERFAADRLAVEHQAALDHAGDGAAGAAP